VDQFELNVGTFLKVTASDVRYNLEPKANEQMLYFGSLSATVTAGGVAIGGTMKDFGVTGSGGFYTGKTFAVSLSLGAEDPSKLKLPSWLPLKNLAVGIEWRDFNNNPTNFLLTLDAEIGSIQGLSSLQFSGGVKGLKIDVGLLNKGQFPITGIDSFNISVSGKAFGGEFEGQLIAGILKLSSDYRPIASTDTTTVVSQRIFYAGLQGGLTLPGLGKIEARVGFCEFGPLSLFISAPIPIVLDPQSGLTLSDLRGGIDFGATMTDPSVYEKNSDGDVVIDPTTNSPKIDVKESAFGLRSLATSNDASSMTSAQWEENLRQQIARISKSAGGTGVSFDDLTKNMVISAGATLYSSYASRQTFRAEVDLKIDITGKILLTGKAIFADTMSVDAYFYANLTDVAKGSGRFLFLFDLPGQPARSKGGISLYGMLDFGLTDDAGNRLTSEMIESRYYVTRTNTQTFTAGANTTSMSLNYTVLKDTTTTVSVGGTALGADSFTLSGNTLTLKTAPAQGQAVRVTYSYRAQYVDPVTGEAGVNPASTVPKPTGFQVIIAGGVRADLFDNTLWAQLDGQATLTFTPTEFRLDVSAKLEVSVLGVIGTAAGKLVIKHGDGFEMYGALRIQTGDGLKKLEQYGLVLQGGLTLTI
ncbi:MAG: hypothetical protein ACKOCK_00505, partial [Chloroflexota bacterium]